MNREFYEGSEKARVSRLERAKVQRRARALSKKAEHPPIPAIDPGYRQDDFANASYDSPGKGVSGESSN